MQHSGKLYLKILNTPKLSLAGQNSQYFQTLRKNHLRLPAVFDFGGKNSAITTSYHQFRKFVVFSDVFDDILCRMLLKNPDPRYKIFLSFQNRAEEVSTGRGVELMRLPFQKTMLDIKTLRIHNWIQL